MSEEKEIEKTETKEAATNLEPAVVDEKAGKIAKPAFTPKNTARQVPAACAACGKNFPKKMWYYRNANFFCNVQCYKKKIEDDKKKAAKESEKTA
ncbi:MAG: hypothetical protein HQL28_00250 [Candidatus Omnitrophica bacterium]|nr:hypothetical protein [Candidatus Omnitrophota bacterium]